MSRKLKELYENPFFHGIKTKDEAEALWKESQNPEGYLWFAMESKDQILTYIYQGSSHDPINLYSGSFLRCHLMIANYRVKKFIRKPQYVIKINSFDWELLRVSVQGVESLWGDCRFIPAVWGSQQQICAILLFLKTFHYKND